MLAIALSVLPWFMTSNYPFSIFKLFLISSKNCGSFCVSVSLPSSTSLELWSTQTDYQVQHLQNYVTQTDYQVHHLQNYGTQTDYQVQHLKSYGTQTDYQVHHLQSYGAHKLITKFNVIRTTEHIN